MKNIRKTVSLGTDSIILSNAYIADHVFACLRPVRGESKDLVMPYLDLEMYFRVHVSVDQEEGSYIITTDLADRNGLSAEALKRMAFRNAHVKCVPMADMLGFGFDCGLHVLMTDAQMYGAAAITTEAGLHELRSLAEKFGTDQLGLIPSSVHEWIIFDSRSINPRGVARMIREVNATELVSDDILSDHPYVYTVSTNQITF